MDSLRFGGVSSGGTGVDGTLPPGIAGFYGLGINVSMTPLDHLRRMFGKLMRDLREEGDCLPSPTHAKLYVRDSR